MERRNKGSGSVDEVPCRSCDEPILLDSAKMLYRGDYATQPCEACGKEARLRLSDLNRPPLKDPDARAKHGFHLPPLLPEEPIPFWPRWLTERHAKGGSKPHE